VLDRSVAHRCRRVNVTALALIAGAVEQSDAVFEAHHGDAKIAARSLQSLVNLYSSPRIFAPDAGKIAELPEGNIDDSRP